MRLVWEGASEFSRSSPSTVGEYPSDPARRPPEGSLQQLKRNAYKVFNILNLGPLVWATRIPTKTILRLTGHRGDVGPRLELEERLQFLLANDVAA
jgi:hypothetical protein